MIDIPDQIPTFRIAAASAAFLLKHFPADFLFQTDRLAAGKDRPPARRQAPRAAGGP
jgi:hypothetical protein